MGYDRLGIAALAAVILLLARPVGAEPNESVDAASSSAFGMSAEFSVDGGGETGLAPVGFLGDAAPPAYNDSITVAKLDQQVVIATGSTSVPALNVTASGITSTVSSPGIEIDSISATGKSKVDSVSMQLMSEATVSDLADLVELSVTASNLTSSSTYDLIYPSTISASSRVNIGKLTISGPLIGGRTLTFSGDAAPGTILYQSATVTVTLNRRVEAGIISCGPTCLFTITDFTTAAVEIDFDNLKLDGDKISGSIVLAQSRAAE
jgi:hypothetical protein